MSGSEAVQTDLEQFAGKGSGAPRPVSVLQKQGIAVCQGRSVPLAPLALRIVGALNDAAPEFISEDELKSRLYESNPPRSGMLRVQIAIIRERFAEVEFPARIVNRWGLGYRLEVGGAA